MRKKRVIYSMESIIPLFLLGINAIGSSCLLWMILVLSFVSLLIALFRKKEELSIFFLVFTVSVLSFSLCLSLPPFGEEDAVILGGSIISPPSYRGGNTIGFNLDLKYMGDREGNYRSAKGRVYVIAPNCDGDYGDGVIVKGSMMDGFFLSSSSYITNHNPWGRGRRRVLSLLTRGLERGSVGNITLLLLTGSTLDGSREIQEKGRELGLSHLIALSGMHLALINMAFGVPLEKILGRKKGRVISFLILFSFVYINGFRTSLFRAFILFLLSPLIGTGYGHALSFLFMMKTNPYLTTDYAALLSFSALSGILFVSKALENRKSAFVSTLGALSATVPFSFSLFGYWSLYSLFLSLPGALLIEGLFFIIILNNFIPKLDCIIAFIYDLIVNLPSLLPPLIQNDLTLYWPIVGFTLLLIFSHKAFPTLKRWIIIKVCGTSIMTAPRKSREY